MYDASKSVGEFLAATAARQPTPGGGSVSALVAALAAALGEMVVNYSIGKKGLEAYADELKPALAELTRAREILVQLMVEDQQAYEALTSAKKLPKDSPERAEKLPLAILACVRVPEAIAATAVAVIERCDKLVTFVNFYLLSDLAVCVDLSMAAIRCSTYSVRANLSILEDPEDRRAVESRISQILSRALMLVQSAAPRIWEREQQGS
jgi:formiminotetrahydrofolate cyclodeaminase